ncbi:hypothetical protein GG681_11420 [Epibacterium sp. SM1969]|uniref:Internalin-A n=1 Tax=Tritonibacter aquimaris TaxID=2663379 RepID=A0A844AZ88_9RHOB|nr:leucine-rich repeat domain-containing protein [Tritonibacter aquimaris]MQY43251.1 hypothetical protein [Tritonibacter aquimaris]
MNNPEFLTDWNVAFREDPFRFTSEYAGGERAILLEFVPGDRSSLTELPATIDQLGALHSVSLTQTNVKDVSRLAQFRDMKELFLSGTKVRDLSALAVLTELETLVLQNVQIDDLSFVRNMKSLSELCISGSQVADISPLAGCKKLRSLGLNNTPVRDISALAKLSRLRWLNLDHTQIDTLDALASHKSLGELSASFTSVSDLSPLSAAKQLTRLRCDGTGVSDLSPLVGSPRLTTLSMNGCPIEDLSPLATLRKLQYVYLAETKVRDISPIAGFKLYDLYLDGSEIEDLTPLRPNRSMPRLACDVTGVSFRDTPLTRMDPAGFGDIASVDAGNARTDELFAYLRKLKTWPPAGAKPHVELAPLPELPAQIAGLRLAEDSTLLRPLSWQGNADLQKGGAISAPDEPLGAAVLADCAARYNSADWNEKSRAALSKIFASVIEPDSPLDADPVLACIAAIDHAEPLQAALVRNMAIALAACANAYMADTYVRTTMSRAALCWLQYHQAELVQFSQTQEDLFADWMRVSLQNVNLWHDLGVALERRPFNDPEKIKERAEFFGDIHVISLEGGWSSYDSMADYRFMYSNYV